jgi:hypothetical protein
VDPRALHEAAAFAALAVATVVLLALGVAAVVIGVLALTLEGTAGPLVVGCALLIGAAAAGWATYRRLLRLKDRVETRQRSNQVFVSYRTSEHASAAARAAQTLRDHGMGAYFAEPGATGVDLHHPLAAFRVLGLFQAGGLDADLQRALARSDAVLFFVPTSRPAFRLWQGMKDQLDGWLSMFLFASGVTPTFWRWVWYMGVYGRQLSPVAVHKVLAAETWQAWELAVARQLGVAVVKVGLGEEGGASPDPELLVCDAAALERDLRRAVIPRLREATSQALQVEGPFPLAVLMLAGWGTLALVAATTLLAVMLFFALT